MVRTADATTRWVTTVLGASPTAGRRLISEEELRDLVAANTRLDPVERRIIDEVLTAGARLVREVMVPRPDVVFFDACLTLSEASAVARSEFHSRFPVIDGTHDDVVGVVYLRDLIIRPDGDTATTVRDLMRDVKRLPASKRVLAALSEMRREGQHLAVVIDEYGGTAGIVTLEDLIEELVGEINDEFLEPAPVGALAAGVDGRLNLADFAERTGFTLRPGPYETVGGFLMAALGRLPVVGDEVRISGPADEGRSGGGWLLRVLALDGRRVARVAVVPAERPVPVAAERPDPEPAVGGAPVLPLTRLSTEADLPAPAESG
ncbi:MAG TPA: hemolysin family protein [Pilimelia sp.]|nr:hemolysin family protein [Pilimelia sp.]